MLIVWIILFSVKLSIGKSITIDPEGLADPTLYLEPEHRIELLVSNR